MQLSARNQLRGRITSIKLGGIMAQVSIDIGGGNTLTSVITRASAEEMGLEVGQEVTAVIKSTEIMVAR
jgi:molybdopterin-binding protein